MTQTQREEKGNALCDGRRRSSKEKRIGKHKVRVIQEENDVNGKKNFLQKLACMGKTNSKWNNPLTPRSNKKRKHRQRVALFTETKLREQFEAIDIDNSGKIDKLELRYLLTKCTGSVPTDDEVSEMMTEVDTNHNGLVDFDEFIVIHEQAKSGNLRFASLSQALMELDRLDQAIVDDSYPECRLRTQALPQENKENTNEKTGSRRNSKWKLPARFKMSKQPSNTDNHDLLRTPPPPPSSQEEDDDSLIESFPAKDEQIINQEQIPPLATADDVDDPHNFQEQESAPHWGSMMPPTIDEDDPDDETALDQYSKTPEQSPAPPDSTNDHLENDSTAEIKKLNNVRVIQSKSYAKDDHDDEPYEEEEDDDDSYDESQVFTPEPPHHAARHSYDRQRETDNYDEDDDGDYEEEGSMVEETSIQSFI